MEKETWKDVKDYENIYKVSNLGRIKSLDRYVKRKDGVIYFKKGTILELIINEDGYAQCKLCKQGKCTTVKVHRVVANAFVPNPNNLPEVNHKDFNRSNNSASNLEWSNHDENVKYSAKNGHYAKPSGEKNSNYGGTKLKNFFKEHPEEKIKLSRPGSQNGRSVKIKMIYENNEYIFEYIGECVNYLLENHIINDISFKSLHSVISKKSQTGEIYKGLKFERIS